MYLSAVSKQRGFLIPVAIFIVAGLSVVAISIARLASQSGVSSFREGLSVQTFYAADSGVQYGLNQVLFASADRAAASSACALVNGSVLNFTVAGLNQCTTTIQCSTENNSVNTVSYYSVRSSSRCGVGELRTERTVQATAYLE